MRVFVIAVISVWTTAVMYFDEYTCVVVSTQNFVKICQYSLTNLSFVMNNLSMTPFNMDVLFHENVSQDWFKNIVFPP